MLHSLLEITISIFVLQGYARASLTRLALNKAQRRYSFALHVSIARCRMSILSMATPTISGTVISASYGMHRVRHSHRSPKVSHCLQDRTTCNTQPFPLILHIPTLTI